MNKVLKTTLIKSIERQNSSKNFYFSDHFEIQEQIGRGGTGDVWKARHHGDGSMYAIKVSINPGNALDILMILTNGI